MATRRFGAAGVAAATFITYFKVTRALNDLNVDPRTLALEDAAHDREKGYRAGSIKRSEIEQTRRKAPIIVLLINLFFMCLALFGPHNEVGIAGFWFFAPAYFILEFVLPASSPLRGPEIDLRLSLFVVQFLILATLTFAFLALKKRLSSKQAKKPTQE
jgi:hypothetical protein